jgi:hypothetical protein
VTTASSPDIGRAGAARTPQTNAITAGKPVTRERTVGPRRKTKIKIQIKIKIKMMTRARGKAKARQTWSKRK